MLLKPKYGQRWDYATVIGQKVVNGVRHTLHSVPVLPREGIPFAGYYITRENVATGINYSATGFVSADHAINYFNAL